MIIGIGAPIQLIAKCFYIKPDKQIAEEKKMKEKKARLEALKKETHQGEDDKFLQVIDESAHVEGASDKSGSTASK